jgi:ATP-dependent Lon protease
MKESIAAARTFVRSHALDFGIEPSLFKRRDIHIHLPEGATPKDGPSAGVALVAAIVSLATNIPARRDVAMTGEITLRGRVLPIGGLKEKMLAALRAGVKKVLIPQANAKDLADIPQKVRDAIEIVQVKHVDEIFSHVLTQQPQSIEGWAGEEPLVPMAQKNEDIRPH